MKARPQKDPYENYFNEDDLEGYHVEYIFPKQFRSRRKLEIGINERILFEDDLIDPDVESETMPRFTERIRPSKLKDMSPKEKAAYLQFLLDLRKEEKSESLS